MSEPHFKPTSGERLIMERFLPTWIHELNKIICSLFLIMCRKHLLYPQHPKAPLHAHTDAHTQSLALSRSIIARWSTKPQWDAGLGFPAPSIQCDHVLDRRKQKLRSTVSTSDGANPNLATVDAAYSRTLTRGFQPFTRLFAVYSC